LASAVTQHWSVGGNFWMPKRLEDLCPPLRWAWSDIDTPICRAICSLDIQQRYADSTGFPFYHNFSGSKVRCLWPSGWLYSGFSSTGGLGHRQGTTAQEGVRLIIRNLLLILRIQRIRRHAALGISLSKQRGICCGSDCVAHEKNNIRDSELGAPASRLDSMR